MRTNVLVGLLATFGMSCSAGQQSLSMLSRALHSLEGQIKQTRQVPPKETGKQSLSVVDKMVGLKPDSFEGQTKQTKQVPSKETGKQRVLVVDKMVVLKPNSLPNQEFSKGVALTVKRADGTHFTLYIKDGDMFHQGAEAVVDAAGNPPFKVGAGGVSWLIHQQIDQFQKKNVEAKKGEEDKINDLIKLTRIKVPLGRNNIKDSDLEEYKSEAARFYKGPKGWDDWDVGSAWLNSNDFVRVEYKGSIMRVIHATGPICSSGQDVELLHPAYKNALIEAEKGGLKSVAFPLLSIGIFGCPVKEATAIPVETILDYMVDGHNSSLVEVHLMAYENDEHYNALVDALTKWVTSFVAKN